MITDPQVLWGARSPHRGLDDLKSLKSACEDWCGLVEGAPIYQGYSNLPGISHIPPGVDKVTDCSDKLFCAKVLMPDNSLVTLR